MKKTSAFICLAALGAVSMNAAPLLYDLGTPGSPVRKIQVSGHFVIPVETK